MLDFFSQIHFFELLINFNPEKPLMKGPGFAYPYTQKPLLDGSQPGQNFDIVIFLWEMAFNQ